MPDKIPDKISEILSRGVDSVIDRVHLELKLRGKKKLRIKLGIDPTSQNIHIGRAVALWKLRELQDLGHKIIFIVGDFTGLIGDTSDKEAERPMLSKKQVAQNLKGYVAQVGKILDLKKTEIRYNSEWLGKLKFLEIAEQADQFSLHEFEARENIAKRMKEHKRVSLRELLYPLMQGYDSVAIKADLEVGGSDQLFNLLAGRTLQRFYKQEAQDVMTFSLLEGSDGRKMSSSWGNVINITDKPEEMFGKTMSILDSLIIKYFTICTRLPLAEISQMEAAMAKGGMNPRDAKARLASELVKIYHGDKAAKQAFEEFDRVHKNKDIPDKIPEFESNSAVKILVESGLVKSAGEAKRNIDAKGLRLLEFDGTWTIISDYNQIIKKGSVIRLGKNRFLRIL